MDIFDQRTILDFQKFTFSGHMRSHVYKVLDENIKLGHADYSCYWTLELLCSGIIHSMWETFFEAAAHHINRAAPNTFIYLMNMYEKFAPYEGQYSLQNITDIRNNKDVRKLVCETVTAITLCRKHKLPSLPRIKPEHDFQQITLQENLKSPSANYARALIKNDDPMELYIPFNELVYCLRSDTRDTTKAYYWISWILAYASQYKKQSKNVLECSPRPNQFVDIKYSRFVIWLLWEAVIDASRVSPQSGLLSPYIDALYKFYCLRWNPTNQKSRLCFLVTAIQFICESTTLDIHYSIPQNVLIVQGVIENIPEWISAIIQTQKTFS
jgi:hypothetical protein